MNLNKWHKEYMNRDYIEFEQMKVAVQNNIIVNTSLFAINFMLAGYCAILGIVHPEHGWELLFLELLFIFLAWISVRRLRRALNERSALSMYYSYAR